MGQCCLRRATLPPKSSAPVRGDSHGPKNGAPHSLPVSELPKPTVSAAIPAASQLELAIGEAVAAGAIAIAAAVESCRQNDGTIAQSIKDSGSARIAAVAELALDCGLDDADFTNKAHEAGKSASRQHFTEAVNPHLVDAALDICIADLLGIVGNVVRTERVLRRAWSNLTPIFPRFGYTGGRWEVMRDKGNRYAGQASENVA